MTDRTYEAILRSEDNAMVKRLTIVAVLALCVAGPAAADMIAPAVGDPAMAIDFRVDAWSSAYDQPFYEVGYVKATAGAKLRKNRTR